MKDSIFDGYPSDGRVYLVRMLSAGRGFYVCDEQPIYAAKVGESARCNSAVETECLQLRLGVRLKTIDSCSRSKTQRFDMIRLIDFRNDQELTAFVDLCSMHAEGSTTLTFEELFYSLGDLFRPLRSQRFINGMGLYGELAIIDFARMLKPGIDASRYWQLAGEKSKYDFAFCCGNIEVKSASAQKLNVHVKHSQLFNEDTNYLVVVLLERAPNGESLDVLASRLIECGDCFTDFRSQAELTKQLLRVDEKGRNTPYLVRGIRCYFAEDINCFGEVPDRISDLAYRLDLVDLHCEGLAEVIAKVLPVNAV